MALTITDAGNGTSTSSGASVSTGSTVTAAIGDWLVAIVAADNAGTNGDPSLSSVSDSQGNTWTQRALINNDPGAANAGATLGIFTAPVTNALSSDTVTANFSPNTTCKAIQVYRVQPGSGEAVQFVAADATGTTGNNTTHSAGTVSVTNGDTIFGAAAIEARDAITGDSDTTNGSWSSILSRLADTGATATSMTCSSQYKTVSSTGNQSWACTTGANRDSARSYLILRPVVLKILDAGTGSYALTGTAAATKLGRKVAAAAGSYALTGQTAALRKTWKIAADAGSYSLGGQSAGLVHGWKVAAGVGSYTLNGQDASLTLSAGDKQIVADAGAYDLIGAAAGLIHARIIAAGVGGYSLGGQAASLLQARKIAAGAGSYGLTGAAAQLLQARRVSAGVGSYSLDGQTVGLKRIWRLVAEVGGYAITGSPASLDIDTGINGPVRPRVSAAGARSRISSASAKARVGASPVKSRVTVH